MQRWLGKNFGCNVGVWSWVPNYACFACYRLSTTQRGNFLHNGFDCPPKGDRLCWKSRQGDLGKRSRFNPCTWVKRLCCFRLEFHLYFGWNQVDKGQDVASLCSLPSVGTFCQEEGLEWNQSFRKTVIWSLTLSENSSQKRFLNLTRKTISNS